MSKDKTNIEEKKLVKGCVVYMKASSGMRGYGNIQCVSSVSEHLSEVGLYGHNQHYKIWDIKEIVSYPITKDEVQKAREEARKEEANRWINQPANEHDNRIREEARKELLIELARKGQLKGR